MTEILLNGEPSTCAEGETVGALVDRLRPTGRSGVAIAIDGEVIRRVDWDRTRLTEGVRVELVGAVQGGA